MGNPFFLFFVNVLIATPGAKKSLFRWEVFSLGVTLFCRIYCPNFMAPFIVALNYERYAI